MVKPRVAYFISYEYHDTFDSTKTIKQDSFVTTDWLLYISPSDLQVLSSDLQTKSYRTVTKYLVVNRLDRDTDNII